MSTVSKSYAEHSDPVIDYCTKLTVKLDPLQQKLQDATIANHKMFVMLGAPEILTIGQHFLKLIHGKNCLDVGTFTGASALAWALAVPNDGKVISMDVDHSALDQIGRSIINECPKSAQKIDFRLGSAMDTLNSLIDEGKCGEFDFAFIDADRANKTLYYEKCMQLLRPGGVILVDNALAGGDAVHAIGDAVITDACNRHISADERSHSFLINTGDGLHVAFKA
ncbi:unnamed protein product, partial [Mesorhabditis belari]|uniref:O-methyltransferase n=1 Tax=Mesorhabditis belari TaxID=2138241 RepID=A0AAF3EKV0_9BILA